MFKRALMATAVFAAVSVLAGCGSPPPDEFFRDQVETMVALDRGLGFREEITGITVLETVKYPERVEVKVRVEGWATHPDLTIGATLPASPEKRVSWAMWTFFCRQEEDKSWTIVDKYKVDEGFE